MISIGARSRLPPSKATINQPTVSTTSEGAYFLRPIGSLSGSLIDSSSAPVFHDCRSCQPTSAAFLWRMSPWQNLMQHLPHEVQPQTCSRVIRSHLDAEFVHMFGLYTARCMWIIPKAEARLRKRRLSHKDSLEITESLRIVSKSFRISSSWPSSLPSSSPPRTTSL